jgi:NAD(P)-dependent dehydrogenase (short-subunit alcohol dehydrogenase family)
LDERRSISDDRRPVGTWGARRTIVGDKQGTAGVLDRFRLDGKTAIVTGASSGIGESIVTTFAEVGATVYAVARRKERLDALAKENPAIVPWRADLADADDREGLVAGVVERAGRVDVLVNCAGIASLLKAVDETTADFDRVIGLNLAAPFILCRETGRAMIAQGGGGSIINIASAAALVGIGFLPQAAYSAAKGGCVSMTREFAAQWARHGIRVNSITPGWVSTEMTGEWLTSESGKRAVDRVTPMKRPGTAEELASATLFLASEASSFMTGVNLPVDGGWFAT